MARTPLNLLLIYGLVGLALAGGVVTVSEVTSKVVPVFPRNGQLTIDLVMTPTLDGQQGSSSTPNLSGYEQVNDANHPENFSLNLTTQAIMVYRTGEFNVSSTWTTVPDGNNRPVSLQPDQKVHLATLTLPEGNVTIVRIKLVGVSVRRGHGSSWDDLGMANAELDLPAHARVRAHGTTDVLLNFHLSCPAINGNGEDHSGRDRCDVHPSADDED